MFLTLRRGPTFGRVVKLETSNEFLRAVDAEAEKVTVVVHLYRKVSGGVQGGGGTAGSGWGPAGVRLGPGGRVRKNYQLFSKISSNCL